MIEVPNDGILPLASLLDQRLQALVQDAGQISLCASLAGRTTVVHDAFDLATPVSHVDSHAGVWCLVVVAADFFARRTFCFRQAAHALTLREMDGAGMSGAGSEGRCRAGGDMDAGGAVPWPLSLDCDQVRFGIVCGGRVGCSGGQRGAILRARRRVQ
jgi:hypothetical protein